ncbi:MAG: PQQ-binding-like beta-propeller repeat protein [Nitrospinae bacterium]|nr:PQQ-binding-like beta-propeller repeat protein [Nitrospinota bacterium]
MKKSLVALACTAMVLISSKPAHSVEAMTDYNDVPVGIATSVTPNILILMDNSGSMNDQAYLPPDQNYPPNTAGDTFDATKTYYGYFASGAGCNYNYASNVFTLAGPPGTVGTFSGNFLNWASMRKIDVTRRVLVGGKATSRTGGGNNILVGDGGNGWWVWKYGPTAAQVGVNNTPWAGNPYTPATKITYELSGGYLYVVQYSLASDPNFVTGTTLARYTIKVQKDVTNACDAAGFLNGNVAGLMQQIGTQARFGIEYFNSGCGSTEGCGAGQDGGNIAQAITGPGYGTNFITTIENQAATTWTPLAEALYTAAGYFSQSQLSAYYLPNGTMRYNSGDYGIGIGSLKDPLYFSELGTMVPCAKNFVIVITDGMPTMDANIPASIRDFDGSGSDPSTDARYTDGPHGTDYLDDVALWAHTTDLRPDLDGNQTMTVYTVYLNTAPYTAGDVARILLQNTAKNGGFVDSNGNGKPDLQSEWSTLNRTYSYNGVPTLVPDTYFEASDGAALQGELQSAVTDILKRASSGTSVSVLATSSNGAGNMYQAFYLPSKTISDSLGTRNLSWLGYMMSLNVDSTGALRDNMNNCISFTFDVGTNQTLVNTLALGVNTCTSNVTGSVPLTLFTGLNPARYNWEAGNQLYQTSPPNELLVAVWPPAPPPAPTQPPGVSGRYIFTLSSNHGGLVGAGEQIPFTQLNASVLQNNLRAGTLAEAQNIVSWIRGNSVNGYRDRTLSSGSGSQQWKLGDIVYSSPTPAGLPLEAYNLLYKDTSYADFYASRVSWWAAKTIKEVVYVGANDGMLHAFDGNTGNELWAYIPFNLLPHLKWLTSTSYGHVDYVDMKVKVTDVKLADGNWHTILIGGMRFGGGETCTAGNCPGNVGPFRSSFFAIDITDPGIPSVLWELNGATMGVGANAMGFAMTYPCIVKVGDNFFAVVGSGTKDSYVPDYAGNVTTPATLFVINIKTGALATSFVRPEATAYFSSPVAVDIDMSTSNPVLTGTGTSYNTDAVYVAETYVTGGVWYSNMMRLAMNNKVDPTAWTFGTLLASGRAGQAVTSAPAVSNDNNGNVWVFFGTGKLFSNADKTDTSVQTVYGVKDPCWNTVSQTWTSACLSGSPLALTNLVNTTGTNVFTSGSLTGNLSGQTTFTNLQNYIASKGGWYFDLTSTAAPAPSERSLNKPTVFGGLVLFTTFMPSTNVCGMGGNSNIYALYYLTGTAHLNPGAFGFDSGTGLVYNKSQSSVVGMASAITIHSGREAGVTAFIQMSTGQTATIGATPAISTKSGVVSWREL